MTDTARPDSPWDAQAIEAGRVLFAQPCTFVLGATRDEHLPDGDLPEVAFAGRSNVGKSSLINALTGRKDIARASNTPGRTQQVNLFDLGGRLQLADLPGYGYAKASKGKIQGWTGLMKRYLRGRAALRRALVLIDARHGLKGSDTDMFALLDTSAVVFQVVLTKADKTSAAGLSKVIDDIRSTLSKHPAGMPDPLPTSARDGDGIAELRAELAALASPLAVSADRP